MITAWPVHDSLDLLYTLRSDYSYETYQRRGSFKRAGARWVSNIGWQVTEQQRRDLGIERIVRVRVSECHESPKFTMIPESQAVIGSRVDAFCGMCDSHYSATVLEIVDRST